MSFSLGGVPLINLLVFLLSWIFFSLEGGWVGLCMSMSLQIRR